MLLVLLLHLFSSIKHSLLFFSQNLGFFFFFFRFVCFLLQFPLSYLPALQIIFSNNIILKEETYGRVCGSSFCLVCWNHSTLEVGRGEQSTAPGWMHSVVILHQAANKHWLLSCNFNSMSHLSFTPMETSWGLGTFTRLHFLRTSFTRASCNVLGTSHFCSWNMCLWSLK